MKRCLKCNTHFEQSGWQCPACCWGPATMHGYPAFAPELAVDGNGFASEAHEELARLEASCFWFSGRNDLVRYALGRFFPGARSFLEVGCGTGYTLSAVLQARPGMRVVGGELFFTGLQHAGGRLPDVELLQMDARRIPYAGEFDIVGAFDVLEHIEEDQKTLKEMFAAVKQGGGIIVTVPQHPWLWSRTDEFACHKRRYTGSELRTKIESAGFRVAWMTSYMTLLLPAIILSRIESSLFPPKAEKDVVFGELKINPVINAVLDSICKFERGLLYRGVTLPLGGSLLCVARKEGG